MQITNRDLPNTKLYSARADNRDAIEGAIGYYLYMILCVLKNERTYTDTLALSPCRKDGTISLSRIILTIIREKGDRCSLYDLFSLLVPIGYKPNMICPQIWNLCEVARNNAWRRLLLFDLITPSSLDELKKQADIFNNGDEETNHYTELIICTAGQAYMNSLYLILNLCSADMNWGWEHRFRVNISHYSRAVVRN